ncbi:alpha/beta hydrolase [Opitutaceae bacterium]|nr:alpha/beta hydrolase [Opitutaceae bacterium]
MLPSTLRRRLICLALITGLCALPFSRAETNPVPQMIPGPGPITEAPYAPRALMPGGIVIPVFPPGSPYLNPDRVHEAEIYEMSTQVPGRIQRLKNVHNPSIEVHPVENNNNTGAAIILIPGGGHHHLGIAAAGTDMVSAFYNYGITTFILRYRLRDDGYVAEVDAVNDVLQAIRYIRANADRWGIDPLRIGVFGSSAGGEVATGSALNYPAWDTANNSADDPLAGISSRPDFVGLLYTGPSDITRDPAKTIPPDVPPSFIACPSYGEDRHTRWSMDYYLAMLEQNVPNIEMHLYASGRHGGGLKDRQGTPIGTWQHRFIDWFRDLGFLAPSGTPTKAAADTTAALSPSQP